MFETILAATDGSEHGTKALKIAADLASRYGAKLVLIHVIVVPGELPEGLAHMAEVEHLVEPSAPAGTEVPNAWAPTVRADSDQRKMRVLQTVADRLMNDARSQARAAGVRDVKTFIDDGDPATRILDRARETGADLIVMGRRGLGSLSSLLMGSVSTKISHLSECPCLTVR